MTLMPVSRFVLAAACAALVAVLLVWFRAPGDQRLEPVAAAPAAARPGFKTIEYRGVQVGIPSAWERLDMSGCEFQFEQWVPPGSAPCDFREGAVFYGSATFDPFHRPGVWRTTPKGTGATTWSGYVYAGDYAVYASAADRDLVQAVLGTARMTGSPTPGGR